MARIPTQTASRSLEIGSAPDYSGVSRSPVGAALQGIGNELEAVASQVQRRQEQRDRFQAAQLENEFDARLEGTASELLMNAPADGQGLHDTMVVGQVNGRGIVREPSTFDKLAKEYEARLPEGQREVFRAGLEGKRLRLSNKMAQAQFGVEQKYYRSQVSETTQRLVNDILTSSGDDATFDELKAKGKSFIDASGLAAADKQEALSRWDAEAAKGLFEAKLRMDPSSAQELQQRLGFKPKPVAIPAGEPEQRANQALAFFVGRGYTQAQAAGIVGNLLAESSLNTGARNRGDGSDGSDSIGIGQWNSDRAANLKRFASSRSADWQDFATQLEFVEHELSTSESGAGKALRAAQNVDDATAAFAGYERPQGWSPQNPRGAHNFRRRVGFAAKLAGAELTSGPPDPRFDALSPSERFAMYRQTETAMTGQAAQFEDGLKDYVSFLRDGNDPDTAGAYAPVNIAATLPPDRAAAAMDEISKARTYGLDKVALEYASPDEVERIFTQRMEMAQSPEDYRQEVQDIGGLQSTLRARNEAIGKDPAAYVAQQPQIGEAYQAMSANPQDTSAARAYATVTIAEQTRLGVPADKQRILPAPAAAEIAAGFSNQVGGPQNAASLMRSLEKQWGDQWPKVFGELAETKQLPGTALVVGAMNRPTQFRAAEALAEASKIGTPKLEESVTSEAKKAVKDRLGANMQEFQRTLLNNGASGASTFLTFNEAVYQLGLSYARNGDGSTAADRAYEDVIKRAYTLQDTYRVPIEYDADDVNDRADSLIDRLTGEGLVLPVSGLNEEQTRAAYLSQVQAKGFWVTSPNEEGLTLFDETGSAVMKTTGQPVSFTWQQILGAGASDGDAAAIVRPPMATTPAPPTDDRERSLDSFLAAPPMPSRTGKAPTVAAPDLSAPTTQDRLKDRQDRLFENAPTLETTFGSAM